MSAETFTEGTTEQELHNNMGQENEYTHDVEMDDDDVDEPVEKQMKPEMTPEQKADISEKKKVEGNKLYVDKKYAMALQLYTEAIELCPTCAAYYSNRSATHIMMNKFKQALEDARMAIRIDPNFAKGHMREGKCHMSMGEASAAVRSYQMALQLDPQSAAAQREVLQAKTLQQLEDRATACYKKGDFRQVVYCMDRCLEISPGCSRFKVLKAECLALLKRYEESQIIANDLLRFDGMNVDAMYVRGLCLYYEDNMDKAFHHFQHVLRLAPDHQHAKTVYKKAKSLHQKKEAGNEAFRVGKLQDALTLYSEALEIDPNNVLTNSKLYNNRATVLAKQKRLDEAITDCTSAIKLDETYTKAYLRRAKCFMDTEKYEEAVRDYEHVYKTNKTREHKLLVQEAKLELKKSKRKDYYKVLGVSKSATDDEIKKAYKKRALAHHPDRHSNATEENRKEEEKKFKEIGQAYTILSDPKKKARYDSGQDLEDLESPGFNDIDPSQIFQAFFGGGGGGGAGGPGHGFHQQGNFPGGFQFQFG